MSALTYHHGIDTVIVPDQAAPIVTAKSSVIGIVGTAGMGPVNVPTLIQGNGRTAIATFGEHHLDGFTLPESFDAFSDSGSTTVIAINVCDPTVHATVVEAEDISLDARLNTGTAAKPYHTAFALANIAKVSKTFPGGNTFQIPDYLTVQSLKIGGTTYALTTDYTVGAPSGGFKTVTRVSEGAIPALATVVMTYEFSAGFVEDVDYTHDAQHGTIDRVTVGSHILPGSTVNAGYTYTDPSLVTDLDIIGAVTSQKYTGIKALLTASAKVKLKPRILLAPRFTETYSDTDANAVVSQLNIAAKALGAIVVCDAVNTTLQEAINMAAFFSNLEDRVYMHFPYHIVMNPDVADDNIEQPAAARIAGHIAVNDNTNGFWDSPSNHEIAGVLGLSKDLSYGLQDTDTDVDLLNSSGVVSTVFQTGFELWGNRMCSLAFLSVQRISDMVTESIAVSQAVAVDRNITKGLVEFIVNSITAYLRILENTGALIPNPNPDAENFNDAWADPDLNTPDQVAQGNLFIDYRFNPPFPAEHIHFRAHVTRAYITSIFING